MLTRRMIERLWFVWLFFVGGRGSRFEEKIHVALIPPKALILQPFPCLFISLENVDKEDDWPLFFMQSRGPLFVFGQCWQREWLATLAASQLLFVCSSLENRSKDVCSSSPKPSVWSDLNILISRPFWEEQQESDQIIRDNQSLDVSRKIILDRNLDARKTTVAKVTDFQIFNNSCVKQRQQ